MNTDHAKFAFPYGTKKVFRKFHKFDADKNSNKTWQLTATLLGNGDYEVLYEYGRARLDGTLPGHVTKTQTHHQVHKKMVEQYDEDGYSYLDTAVEAVTQGVALSGHVGEVVRLILDSARLRIDQYLATNIDRLSLVQISQARNIVAEFSRATQLNEKRRLVSSFYSAIPTQLAARIDLDELVREFNADEQRERLDQLGAAVQFSSASNQGSVVDLVGAEIEYCDESDEAYLWAVDAAKANLDKRRNNGDPVNHHIAIQSVFRIKIPSERKRFEASRIGKSKIRRLTHGTRNENVAHILRSSLLVEKCSSSSIFGYGIYGADYLAKSCNFTGHGYGYGTPHMMFLADFATGNEYVAPDSYPYRSAPAGYDSVWGKKNETKHGRRELYQNEFIVYRNEQVTVTHLVVGTWS